MGVKNVEELFLSVQLPYPARPAELGVSVDSIYSIFYWPPQATPSATCSSLPTVGTEDTLSANPDRPEAHVAPNAQASRPATRMGTDVEKRQLPYTYLTSAGFRYPGQ